MTKLRRWFCVAAAGLCTLTAFAQDRPSSPPEEPPPLRRPDKLNKPANLHALGQDRWHHRDGSSILAFEAGGGWLVPAGYTGNTTQRGWNLSAGVGLNASRRLGILLQGDYQRMPIASKTLKSLGYPGGNIHLWSASLNPILHYHTGYVFGAYLVGGGGFYRTVTEFTSSGEYPACQSGTCFVGNSNAILAQYYANALGFSGGVGFDWKLYPPAAAKVFMESRYTWVGNQKNSSLAYPAAADRVGMFPITFGLRW